MVMLSSGGPFNRSASPRLVSLLVVVCGVKVRVSVSGLYWNTTTLANGLAGSSPMMAPFCSLGEPGKVVMRIYPLLFLIICSSFYTYCLYTSFCQNCTCIPVVIEVPNFTTA